MTVTDDVANLILERLRRIGDDVGDMRREMRSLAMRVGNLESSVAGLRNEVAGVSIRLDHVNERLDRVERRLEIRGGSAA